MGDLAGAAELGIVHAQPDAQVGGPDRGNRASHAALEEAMSFITAASFVPDDLST